MVGTMERRCLIDRVGALLTQQVLKPICLPSSSLLLPQVLTAPHCVPGPGLSASHAQSQLNLTTFLGGRNTLYIYSTTKGSKTRGKDRTCPGSHSREVIELAFVPGLSDTTELIVLTTSQSPFVGEEMDMS